MLQSKITSKPYHIIFPVVLVLFLTVGVFITVNQTQENQNISSHAAGISNCSVSSSQLSVKTQEQNLLNEINQYRALHAVQPLKMDSTLKQAAAWLSTDMVKHNALSHIDSLNRSPDIRLADCGYMIKNGYGENIAKGPADASVIFNAWRNDQAHNQVLLNQAYTIVGIDTEQGANNNFYWTMDFGANAALAITPNTSQTPSLSSSRMPSTVPSISQLPSATAAPVTADMLIAVSVKIFGIGQGGNIHPRHLTRRITALVYGTDNTPVTTGTGFLTYDGNNFFTGTIHLGKLSQGSYFIKLSSDNTLQVLAKPEFQKLVINQLNVIPPVTLYQGDLNQDNVLDINDYNLALPCFQSIATCANAGTIDFNDDGRTDVTDYNLFLQSFETLHGN